MNGQAELRFTPMLSARVAAGRPSPSSQPWRGWSSLRLRLFALLSLLLILVLGLGVLSIRCLSDVNQVSEVIRTHWLEDTRILGDFSNYMSDYRAAEATRLLASTREEALADESEIEKLGATVSRSQRAYEALAQNPAESLLYLQAAQQWAAYQKIAAQVVSLARAGETTRAIDLYMTDSRRTFNLCSDTLARLTDQTVAQAAKASTQAAVEYSHVRALIMNAVLLVTLLLLGLIVYITRSLLNPIFGLALRMHALADQDTSFTIPGADRKDEIGEMARSVAVFRDNALALINSQRRLVEQAARLEDLLETEQRLTVQQRNFVSMTSHEFRTALSIIDGHAQRLIKLSERTSMAPSDVAERSTRIRSAVLRMTSTMDRLLGAAQLLDGPEAFNPSQLDPAALLRQVCQTHREASREANIREDFDAPMGGIHGDPELLFLAFSNLISNAVKFSPAGSPVEVTAREESQQLIVQVRDSGIGIPASDLGRLFERYFRGDKARGIPGTGVGLHLVAMVAKLHAGEVSVESLDVGSRFTLRLPIRSTADVLTPVPRPG
jgi:two-component system, OmpR family, sensor kinase